MRRRLVLVNAGLLIAVVAFGWLLRRSWSEAHAREQATLRRKTNPAPLAPLPLSVPPPVVSAASYIDVAQKMLFAKDRNPNVILDVKPPKPMPPLPRTRGFLDFGGDPTVLLAEKPGGEQKAYRPGDAIGDFKLVSVTRDDIVFEWEGKTVKRTMEELADHAAAAAESQQAAPSAPNGAPASGALSGDEKKGPGSDVGGGYRACVPGDATPSGAVVDGMKKVVTATPFGSSCQWVPAK